uniref:WH2 domain-containing protein n=1 Tax=Parastrongyloides trichosuri TaxID=131310 RepID=A0A0N4ZEI6_PARTI
MPPPPPPPPAPGLGKAAPKADRGALLNDIHKGFKLKKTVTNDRSTPLIAGKVSGSNENSNNVNNKVNGNSNNTNTQRPILPSVSGSNPTAQLNSMFSGGFPKKPSEMKNMLNKPVSSQQPVVRPPSPEIKKPNPPVIKPKPNNYPGTLQKKNDNISSSKDDISTGLRPRPGGPPPPPPPKKFSGQMVSGTTNQSTSQGPIPPPPPPIFNKPIPTSLPNPIPPQSYNNKPSNNGAVSPIRPPPPPPQRLQSIPGPAFQQQQGFSSMEDSNNDNRMELNNNSKIEKLVETFYSRFTFTPLNEIPPPPEFKNIPKEYPAGRRKIVQKN